jgi:hypothetical protein
MEPNTPERLLVPAPLFRVRQFLDRRGLKIKPWVAPAVALDSFYDLLRSHEPDPVFWSELRALLSSLVADLERRRAAGSGAVANQVLDPATHQALLDEIRIALASRPAGSSFGELSKSLSPSAVGALCLVAAVALTACGGETLDSSSATSVPDPHGGWAGTGGATNASGAGGQAGGGDVGGSGGGGGDADGGAGRGGATFIFDAFAPPDPSQSTADASDAPCQTPLVQTLQSCSMDDATRSMWIECLDTLNASWTAGLQALVGCKTCEEVQRTVCWAFCGVSNLPEQYSYDAMMMYCMVELYKGVRFE